MGFRDEDLVELFGEIGGKIEVELGGVNVATIRGRIKKEVVTGSPFDVSAEVLVPILSCPASALAGLTKSHVFIYQGTRYRYARDAKPDGAGIARVAMMGA